MELFSLIVEFRWFDENLFLRLTNMYIFKLMLKRNVIGRKAKVTSLNMFLKFDWLSTELTNFHERHE